MKKPTLVSSLAALSLLLFSLLLACNGEAPQTESPTAPPQTATASTAATAENQPAPTASPRPTETAEKPQREENNPPPPSLPTGMPTETTVRAHPETPESPTSAPGDSQQVSVLKFNAEELECLPPELHDGALATQILTSGQETLDQREMQAIHNTMMCLESENLIRFIAQSTTGAGEGISDESFTCALQALPARDTGQTAEQPTGSHGPAEGDPAMTGITALLGITMVIAYCLSDEEWETMQPGPQSAQELEAIRCTIDTMGGPAEYLATMNKTGEEGMQQMILTSLSCQPQQE